MGGNAGVGKTALLRAARSSIAGDVEILWAVCLPLASMAVPFLPLISAMREWTARGGDAPPLDGAQRPAADVVVQVDRWLQEVCRRRPLLLVVDDLQWADQSTLDLLMYVIAGPAQRRLAIAATLRTDEVEHDPRLRDWLANVRRLPGVAELRLTTFDRPATVAQLAQLLGGPPHESLVDDVFRRSRGNAYLTTLLARDLAPNARRLPTHLPTELHDAVAHTWRGLSHPAQTITQLIAVAGRPVSLDELHPVTAVTGVNLSMIRLREAVDRGVLETVTSDRYWFVHPLLAEVLEEMLLPDERRAWHAAFAASLDPGVDPSNSPADWRVVGVADHYHRAGNLEQAFRWALPAAATAERMGGASEGLRLLRRAYELLPTVNGTGVSQLELLERIRAAAERAGDQPQELAAVDELLELVDRGRQPLCTAELLVRRMLLRHGTGQRFAELRDVREAVQLTAEHPTSAQHALAMAELAHAELWHGLPGGAERARQAVQLSRACGSAKALTYALTANVMARCLADTNADEAEAREAQAAAAQVSDFWAYIHATLWWTNTLDCVASPAVLEHLRRSREEMTARGAPHGYLAMICAVEAAGLLLRGNWRACSQRLRVALGSDPGAWADTNARLTAAMLACWQGRITEAHSHLARAEELFAEHSAYLSHSFEAVHAELAIAAGDTNRVLAATDRGLASRPSPTMVERLLPLAARALANDVQNARDHGADPSLALARLDDLHHRYPNIVADMGPGPVYQAQRQAMQALYDAELAQARLQPDSAPTWLKTAQACKDAHLAWDEAYARRKAAQLLLPHRASRKTAIHALRQAYDLAHDLQAKPLLVEIEALAQTARVTLSTPPAHVRGASANQLPGLTRREREVLAHIATGSTYAEIAHTLTLSEKTISTHVSNILRKTGTNNRIELAQLANRLTPPAPDA